ncbi:hypothetical protein PINS_up005712 [Pythium insidiosum]|nr:hypothetical protein PINS_up005712 [Pythium insidiosum]
MAIKRLRKEYIALQKKPVEYIQALPLETNILEWHYVITGTPGTPYEGGYYHGVLKFPPEYPMKPPAVKMITPNGRFMTDKRLCLSMSDFHPETWNPMWSVSSILTGLYSFMIENQPTLGSIVTTDAQKRKYASQSLETNCNNPLFRKLFPDLVELHHKQVAEREAALRSAQASEDGAPSASSNVSTAVLPGGSNGGATLANVVAKDKDFLQDQAFIVYGGIGVLLLAVAVLYLFS